MDKTSIIETLIKNGITNSYVLAEFYNKVCFGIFENNEIYFYSNVNYSLCNQIRFFNKEKELKIINNNDKIYTKLITDTNQDYKLKDEFMFISGNKIIDKNDKFTVVEQMGRKLEIPLNLLENDIKNGVRLVVRNYLKVDENNQVTISDSRLVGFSKNEMEVL